MSIFCALVISLAASVRVEAQLFRFIRKAEAFEISGGPSLVSLHNKFISKETRVPKIGSSFGIGMRHQIMDRFKLNTRLIFERKGIKNRYDVWYYDPTIDFDNCKCTTSKGQSEANGKMDYYTLQTSFQYQFERPKLLIEGGLFASYLSRAKGTVTNLWDNTYYHYDAIDRYHRIDGGLSFAIGRKIHLSNERSISIIIRENLGLTNISKIGRAYTRTNALSLLAVFTISDGK